MSIVKKLLFIHREPTTTLQKVQFGSEVGEWETFKKKKKASGLFCEMLGASRHDILGLHSQRRRTIDVVTSRAGWGVGGGGDNAAR